MQKWEYRIIDFALDKQAVDTVRVFDTGLPADEAVPTIPGGSKKEVHYLNQLGQEGWEVLNVEPFTKMYYVGTRYFLKRPL